MKRTLLFFALLLSANALLAQNANNLFWSMMVDVKMDKKLEWEKKLMTYTKTHMPQVKYRTYEIISGDNSGSYVIVMGPISYKDMDVPLVSPKGEALMKMDGQGLDALCNRYEVNYFRRQNDISSANTQRKIKYLLVTSYEIEIGSWGSIFSYIKNTKEARDKGGSKMDIDYFRPSNSGVVNAFGSVRYVEKLEDFDSAEDQGEMYDKVFGNNSYYEANREFLSRLKSIKSEVRVLRTDLSVL